jgi:membrane-associated phospholipid phosphatase
MVGQPGRRARAEPPAELHFRTAVDLPITLALLGGYALSEAAFKKKLAPARPRWSDRRDGNDALNPFDRAGTHLRWSDPRDADALSNLSLYVLTGLSSLGFTAVAAKVDRDTNAHAWENSLIILEATSIAAATTQVTKFVAGRQRPCAHLGPPGATSPCGPDSHDENLSFISGHATVGAALAVSSGVVASLRRYSLAPLVWSSGALFALSTGYLRIAANKHYLSDVLVGFAVGSALGAAVPLLFHGQSSDAASPGPRAPPPIGNASFGYSGVW